MTERISDCRKEISKWKRITNLNSKIHIRQLRQDLDFESSKLSPNFQRILELKIELEKVSNEDEKYWKHKSKENWALNGDKNTHFFHGSVQTQRIKNQIVSLFDDQGIEQFEETTKGDIAVDYFTKLFHTSNPGDMEELLHGFEPKVTSRMNRELIKDVSEAEIHRAVKAIKGDSALGIDGMSGNFFQSFRKITGPQVIIEVKRFFETGWFPHDWNHTQLFMLPKKPNPTHMTDLRPISLCSVTYKIVSKILYFRLKRILPQLVSPTQGAFVAGRLIFDSLLIAHEMVHGRGRIRTTKETS